MISIPLILIECLFCVWHHARQRVFRDKHRTVPSRAHGLPEKEGIKTHSSIPWFIQEISESLLCTQHWGHHRKPERYYPTFKELIFQWQRHMIKKHIK